jgi:3-hydroxyisobutyrate dehydrogenase
LEKQNIGFIGLGAMGLPMALNLLKHGYHVHMKAHANRTPVETLKAAGAIEHPSLSEVVRHSEVLIGVLPEDRQMQEVWLSSEVLDHLQRVRFVIEMTSGTPAMMKKIAQVYIDKGVGVLDAPVSGGTVGAEAGTLTVMAGGSEQVLEEAQPILSAMAKNVYRVGDVGAGKAIKAINQMLAGIHMIAAAEAAALSEKLGIGTDVLKQVIGNSSGASWMLLNKMDSLENRAFDPGFKLKLMSKDVRIALYEGKDLHLPLAALAGQLYQDGEKEYGELDFAAIGTTILP